MKIKCLIIDSDNDTIAMLEEVVKKIPPVEIIGYCRAPDKIIEALSENNPDLVFIDPHMDGGNGNFDAYQSLLREALHTIVMSADRGVAKQAFDIDATDFLLKPLTVNRLLRALSKVAKNNAKQVTAQVMNEDNPFFVKDKSVLVKLEIRDIYLIEALADYVNIYTAKKKYTIHATMKKMEAMFGGQQFVRVHKSYIVRIDAISEVENNKLVVEGRAIPISNTYRKELLEKLRIV